MQTPLRFLLAGNSPYLNRGSEAIIRGTTAILRRTFGQDTTFALAEFGDPAEIERQAASEEDPAITHIPLSFGKLSWTWVRDQFDRRLKIDSHGRFWKLKKDVERVSASLQVGGDNYSLEYGFPYEFFRVDEYLIRQRVPVVLWGASVGPFDSDPASAEIAHAHLRRLNGIFVRESRSLEYLRKHCDERRVRHFADPAFAMPAREPRNEDMPSVDLKQTPIGLNFSPLMARFVAGGDMEAWTRTCAEAVISIMKKAGENLLLIPHVFSAISDDGHFLERVGERVRQRTGTSICITSRQLSAAEIKWIIARCSVFVGARTHSTIAALSSGVPTLSLAYSVKAQGLNLDIFGDLQYCITADEMTAEAIATRTLRLLADSVRVRDHLANKIPDITSRSFAAGDYLAELLASGSGDRLSRTALAT